MALNGINNVLSLGLCFLGGVFVPLEMLGNGIVSIAQFLPTYWYSRINGILRDYGELSSELWHTIWAGLLIQLAFALACFGVTNDGCAGDSCRSEDKADDNVLSMLT